MSVSAHSHDPVHDRVLVWLEANPVPPGPSEAFRDWCSRAVGLGSDAIPVLVGLLVEGLPDVQYGALIALRQLGVEAWGHDYEPNLRYEVHVPGQDPRWVVPKHQASAPR